MIFEISIQENVRNSRTTSEEFFRERIQDDFWYMHLRKFSEQSNDIKRIFFFFERDYSRSFFKNLHFGKF